MANTTMHITVPRIKKSAIMKVKANFSIFLTRQRGKVTAKVKRPIYATLIFVSKISSTTLFKLSKAKYIKLITKPYYINARKISAKYFPFLPMAFSVISEYENPTGNFSLASSNLIMQ